MGIRTPQDVFQEKGTNFERSLIQKAQALAFRERVAKKFNIDPEALLSLKTVAEIQTDGQNKMQMAQMKVALGEDPNAVMAPEEINQSATNDILPAISRPELPKGSPSVQEDPFSVDNIPEQNQGLDRDPDQPTIR
jgi:hypothetical protein